MLENNQITVGELAKRGNVTIRTLQYYDKIGLLKPSNISDGGRRLYNDNDITLLHQIITLKSLGLTLKEIGQRLMPVNTTEDVITMLTTQSELIEEQMSKSHKVLESIHMLKYEISHFGHVDWSKYSDMVKLINDNNEYYWVINFLEKDILTKIKESHGSKDESLTPIGWLEKTMKKAVELEKTGVTPDSDVAQELAEQWWQVMMQYTKGEPKLIQQLFSFYGSAEHWPTEFGQIHQQSQKFMEKTIEHFLIKHKITIPME